MNQKDKFHDLPTLNVGPNSSHSEVPETTLSTDFVQIEEPRHPQFAKLWRVTGQQVM